MCGAGRTQHGRGGYGPPQPVATIDIAIVSAIHVWFSFCFQRPSCDPSELHDRDRKPDWWSLYRDWIVTNSARVERTRLSSLHKKASMRRRPYADRILYRDRSD